jgi:hypothetical protein
MGKWDEITLSKSHNWKLKPVFFTLKATIFVLTMISLLFYSLNQYLGKMYHVPATH